MKASKFEIRKKKTQHKNYEKKEKIFVPFQKNHDKELAGWRLEILEHAISLPFIYK